MCQTLFKAQSHDYKIIKIIPDFVICSDGLMLLNNFPDIMVDPNGIEFKKCDELCRRMPCLFIG